MKKNDIIQIKITDINSEGAGVGRYEGIVVFVPYALPDEYVEVLIIKLTKSYAVGKLLNVIISSPDRIAPACSYFYKCGGCDFQHLNYQKELELKCKSALSNIRKLSNQNLNIKKIIGADKIWNYRNKAQFPISKDKEGNLLLGFFSPRSHRVVSIDSCMLQEDKCNSIIGEIKRVVTEQNISIYDELSHTGVLRHIITRSSKIGLMVILVTNTKKTLSNDLVCALKSALPQMTTLIQNINCQKGNIILGNECRVLLGDGYIEDTLCDVKFRLRPLAFLQVNSSQAEKLYNVALDFASLTGEEIVFDAYCGIGIMSLMLARKAKKLIGVEIVPEAIEAAKESAEINNIHNTEFYVGACEEVLPKLLKQNEKPDVLVVDPPRSGCEESLLKAISEAEINKIVYVSCNPATLARDIKLLSKCGYSSSDVVFVDMFCHTKHIESVVCLTRTVTHNMKLESAAFEMIKSGQKTIELRLYDEKRKRLREGDEIVFTNLSTGEIITTKIFKLHIFDSFNTLYEKLPLLRCGYTEENVCKATPTDMERYYSSDKQNEYGVVGIELTVIEK